MYKDHWLSAVTLKRRSRHAKYCIPPEQQVRQRRNQWRTRIPTWCFYRMAVLSFFHNAFVFIFVITMATKQRLVVDVEQGLMGILILEWTFFFLKKKKKKRFQMSDFYFACRKFFISWQIDGGCARYTVRAHIFSHAHFVSVLVPACCHSCAGGYSHIVGHWPHTLHRAMSHVTPHLTTPSTRTPCLSSM